MKRIYVAAPVPYCAAALTVAADACANGFAVSSTWHNDAPTVVGERALSAEEQGGCLGGFWGWLLGVLS